MSSATPVANVRPAAGLAPLNAEQAAQLQLAASAYRPLKRAAGVASFSAITALVLGSSTALYAVLAPDIGAVVAALILIASGTIELVGRRRLLRAELGATRMLMLNQLALFACVAIYCIVQLSTFSTQSIVTEITSMLDQDIESQGRLVHYIRLVHYALYGSVLLASLASQGGLALYYARRRKQVESFRAGAPVWAQQVVHQLRT